MLSIIRSFPVLISLLFLAGCVEGPETAVASGTDPNDPGGEVVVVGGDEQSTVSKFGTITALTNLTNSDNSIVTASFVDFGQPVNRPDLEEDHLQFVEECLLSDVQTGPVVPFASEFEVSVSGNLSAGQSLIVKSGESAELPVMEKVVTHGAVGYSAALPSHDLALGSLTVDIPGEEFPGATSVIIPRADPIRNFLPAPGSTVTKDTVFTWVPMVVQEGEGTVFMEVTIINENSTLTCELLDDGAFTVSDLLALFGDEEFDSGMLAAVSRQTRYDTAVDDGHIVATNLTAISIEVPEDEREGQQTDPSYVPGEDVDVSVVPLPGSGHWADEGFTKVFEQTPGEEHLGMTIEAWFRGPFANGHPLFMFYDGDEHDPPNIVSRDPIDNLPAIPVQIPFEGLGARKYRGFGYRSNQFGRAGVGNGADHVVYSMEMMTQRLEEGGVQIPSNSTAGTYVGIGHFLITTGENERIGAGTFNPNGSAIRFITKGLNSSTPGRMAFYVYGIEDYEAGLRDPTLGKGSTRYRSEADFNEHFVGRWSQVDIEIKLNSSPTARDGFLRAYINGVLMAEHTGERLVGRDDMSFRGWGQFYDQRFAENLLGSTIWYRKYETWFK